MKTRPLPPHPVLLALVLSAVASVLPARIVSYAPVTDRVAVPAIQNRLNRQYVLIESDPLYSQYGDKLVLYDSHGGAEPRVIFPPDGSQASIRVAAVREGDDGVSAILIGSNIDIGGDNPYRYPRFFFSSDSGRTWKVVPFPIGTIPA